jgi:hypothetical protein
MNHFVHKRECGSAYLSMNSIFFFLVIPVQALTGPEVSRRLKFPDFMAIGMRSWKGCNPYAPATFTPQ